MSALYYHIIHFMSSIQHSPCPALFSQKRGFLRWLGRLPTEKLPKEDLRLYSTFLLTFIISAVMLSQKQTGGNSCLIYWIYYK